MTFGDWQAFVHTALAGGGYDAYTRLLADRVRSGHRVVRVVPVDRLDEAGTHGYTVLLERLRALSESIVPHSPAFTRWSLVQRLKMVDPAAEARRFAWILEDELREASSEPSSEWFNTVLAAVLRSTCVPGHEALLASASLVAVFVDPAYARARREIESVFASVARDLATLGYTEAQCALVLGRAVIIYAGTRLGVAVAATEGNQPAS